jgi:ABC-type glycerol-3-phosphate transport system substrate-binding protein
MQSRVLSTALALAVLTTLGACSKKDNSADTAAGAAAPATNATSSGDISTQNTMAAPMDSTHAGMSTQSPLDSTKTKKTP